MQGVRPAAAAVTGAAVTLPVIPTRMLDVGPVQIHCADLAARGAEAGPPLLWIHGLGGWLRNWAANVEHFTELGYRCVAVDLPGFGESTKPDAAYSPRYFRRILATLLNELEIPRATFVGNSMGGMVALAMAVRNPERVDRLVLVDAAGVHQLRRTAVGVSADLAGAIVRNGGRMRGVLRTMRRWVIEIESPELIAELRLEYAKYAEESRAERLRRARAWSRALWHILRTDLRPWLPTINAPTLVVHGKQDKLVPFEAAGIMHREIPGAQLAAFEGVGHVPQMEVPEKFNASVEAFLKG